MLRLLPTVQLRVLYEDRTPFGSAVSGRIDDTLRARVPSIVALRARRGLDAVLKHGEALLAEAMTQGLGELYARPDRLREECLHPCPSEVRPVGLVVLGGPGRAPETVRVPPRLIPELATWIGEWQRGAPAPLGGAPRELWDALSAAGAIGRAPPPRRPLDDDVTFVGHACVRFSRGGSSVLVDPFLLPESPAYPSGYQPLGHDALRPDAVVITHSHPDHFDPGTLLRFGPDVPIHVPAVARESLLAVDMAARLRELGFRRVHTLGWHGELRIGELRVVALPFPGEQPTQGDVLHPEVRNQGNLYLVEAGGRRYAITADAGRDRTGDVEGVALEARRRWGDVDTLFGGYRSWTLYPVRYLFTSVARYALFVPPDQRGARQRIMCDAGDLLDVAERWRARRVVPYADGGAPWYWELGLGPRLDGRTNADPDFDPPPEHVAELAAARPGAPEVTVLRPGAALTAQGDVLSHPGATWPYDLARPAAPAIERPDVSRKKLLLRILANREAERGTIDATPAEVQAMSERFRRWFGLDTADKTRAWLAVAGLRHEDFARAMRDFVLVGKLEAVYRDALEAGLAEQQGLWTAHRFAQEAQA